MYSKIHTLFSGVPPLSPLIIVITQMGLLRFRSFPGKKRIAERKILQP